MAPVLDSSSPGTGHAAVVGCAWCGAPARPVGGRLALCATCGAATTHPAPDERELGEAYSGRYRPADGRFGLGVDALLRRARRSLAARLDRLAPAGPILDVGCGEGALLDALRSRGREALGLERQATRADVRARDVAEFDERAGEWAAVVFWHALEHLRHPDAAVDRVHELLAPGGVLVIAAPNLSSWQARVLGSRWLALDLPRHLVHLPAAALIDGLRDRGFEVTRVSYWRGGQVVFGWLDGLVDRLPGRLDLYDAVRRPAARFDVMPPARRAATLAAGLVLSPVAVALATAEILAGAGGTVYVEARRR